MPACLDLTLKDEFTELVAERRASIGVIGLGYVGLPLLVEFANKGFATVGFDVDRRKTEQINAGESYIGDVASETVKDLVERNQLRAVTDFDALNDCHAIIICVPTPLRKTKEPDISYIMAAAHEVKQRLRRGQLVILDSERQALPAPCLK